MVSYPRTVLACTPAATVEQLSESIPHHIHSSLHLKSPRNPWPTSSILVPKKARHLVSCCSCLNGDPCRSKQLIDQQKPVQRSLDDLLSNNRLTEDFEIESALPGYPILLIALTKHYFAVLDSNITHRIPPLASGAVGSRSVWERAGESVRIPLGIGMQRI